MSTTPVDYFSFAAGLARLQVRAVTRRCHLDDTPLVRIEGGFTCPTCAIVEARCLFCGATLGRRVTDDEIASGTPMCRACAKPEAVA